MNRFFRIIVIVILVILCVSFLSEPLVIFLIKRELKNTFLDCAVNIGHVILKPPGLFILSEVEIKREKIYDFKIKYLGIRFSLNSFVKGQIPEIEIKKPELNLYFPGKNLWGLRQYLNLKSNKPFFSVNRLKLSDCLFDLRTADLSVNAQGNIDLDLIQKTINHLDLELDSLDILGLGIQKGSLRAAQDSLEGYLMIRDLSYNKLKLTQINGKTTLRKNRLSVVPLTCKLFDGSAYGGLDLWLDGTNRYSCKMDFINLSLEKFADDFNLKEKFMINGRLAGKLVFAGQGLHAELLDGAFSSIQPGGTLWIKDAGFLKTLAEKSKQTMEMVVESFKDYKYNEGGMKLSLEEGNLIFNIKLDGKHGKRNLDIIVHNIKPERSGL